MASFIETLAIIADPTRLRMLLLLEKEELTVAELQAILGMGQSRISNHLAQLRTAGLVTDRRAGKNAHYRPAASRWAAELAPVLAAAAGEIAEAARDDLALKVAVRKRRDRARAYFDQLAGKFGRTYCPGRSWEAVANFLFLLAPRTATVADLGAGEGTLAQLLAKRVRKVIAVDNSPKMIEFGARLAKEHGFGNLEYRLGELEDPPIKPASVDIALLSQALHHAEHPARAVASAAKLLRRGGRLVILDLLQHQMEDARELYADRWLGFPEADLTAWLENAGLREVEVTVVSREPNPPHLQTVLATGIRA